MRKSALAFRLLCFTFVALLALLPRAAHTQQTPFPLPREERIKVFDQVWRAVYDNYYDKNFRGVDWRQQKEVFRSQAESAATNAELYRVLRQMLGKLGDAHTRIYSPEDGFDRYRPSGVTIGLVVRRVEGQPVVTWVDPNSDIAKHGIYPGQIVLKVDGESVETVLQKVRKEIGESSTSIALDLQSLDRLFYGPKDQPVSVTFADQDGRQKTVMLARRHMEFQRRVSARQLPYKLGYIEVTGFGPEIERDFDMAMQQMQGTRGLILDLRNNGGGFVTTVSQIASYFFAEETDLGEFITRYGRSTHRRTQKLRNVYREPLIVLVSSRSASGSEIFAAAMQERKRALILGTNPATCGCLLGVSRTLKLSDGGKLNISDTDYRTALGRRVEGIGVKPDQQIEVRIADLTAGRDRSLEIAVDMLGRTIAFGSRDTLLDFKLRIPDFGLRSSGRTQPASQLQK
ncbi:MAG TPA: S41 family peptidase [Blastocatellia bacterium]|nr:S41 family peptidase [Blastocatellia bacterium]HMY75268.1 S41 family peptidase [Blastocatellia bacterium]